MPRKPTGNPNGRPKKNIDQQEFEKLCALQCTLNEVCSWFRVDDVTLNRWCKETYGTTFSEVFKVKRGIGQVSLRRSQFQMAEKNPTMAIWLGKQYLGQRENIEIDHGNNELMEALTGLVRKQIDHD
jgi:hypothetical protein